MRLLTGVLLITVTACATGAPSGESAIDASGGGPERADAANAGTDAAGGGADAAVGAADAAPGTIDAGANFDALAAPLDASGPGVDASAPDASVPDASVPDASVPDANADIADGVPAGTFLQHVHIYIDNFCNVRTIPEELHIPAGSSVNINWHNHSTSYAADVWMSYGGGYLELPEGDTWSETHTWCAGDTIYTGSADIGPAGVPTTTCQHVQFPIFCN